MEELNNSVIDKWRNSVKCGFCKTWWNLGKWDTHIYTCPKCHTDMVKIKLEPMPIRESLITIFKE